MVFRAGSLIWLRESRERRGMSQILFGEVGGSLLDTMSCGMVVWLREFDLEEDHHGTNPGRNGGARDRGQQRHRRGHGALARRARRRGRTRCTAQGEVGSAG